MPGPTGRTHSPAVQTWPVGQWSVEQGSTLHIPVGGSQRVPVGQWTPPQRSLVHIPVAGSHTCPVAQATVAQRSALHTPCTQCIPAPQVVSAQLVSQVPPRHACAGVHEAATQGSVAHAPLRTSQI